MVARRVAMLRPSVPLTARGANLVGITPSSAACDEASIQCHHRLIALRVMPRHIEAVDRHRIKAIMREMISRCVARRATAGGGFGGGDPSLTGRAAGGGGRRAGLACRRLESL
jgi:hypothetical protein